MISTMKVLYTCLVAQIVMLDCALRCSSQLNKPQNQAANNNIYQQASSSLSLRHSTNQLNLTMPHSSIPPRSLDRSNLSPNKNSSSPLDEAMDGPAEWPIMGGASEMGDLLTGENRHISSIMEFSSGKNSSVKRSGLKKKKSSNKTLTFDDEQSDSTDSNEIFDEIEDNPSLSGLQKEPECASHGRYYCTYKEDYPLKLVTEVTKYYKWPLEKLFRDLHAQIMPKLAQDSTGNLVCDSITRVVRPGWARNTNDRWLVVINTDNYHQYVTEVVCQYGPNSRCNFIPPCYYSSCQQRYNTQKLLVIDPANPYRGPFLSEFLFPSCCVCYVPSASNSFQDKYRSSPATIYQRTFQQEASNNLSPPAASRAAALMEEVVREASLIEQSQARPSAAASNKQKVEVPSNNLGPLGPGEVRRMGEQYKTAGGAPCCGSQNEHLSEFPRL